MSRLQQPLCSEFLNTRLDLFPLSILLPLFPNSASRAGNIARFINHLPDADRAKPGEGTSNMLLQAVFTAKDGMTDYRFYRMCLFASEDIPVRIGGDSFESRLTCVLECGKRPRSYGSFECGG